MRPCPTSSGPAGHRSRHPSGCAFTIEEALTAIRWASLVAPKGYRVIVTPSYAGCDEVIEVYIHRAASPAFRIGRTASAVVVIDRLGMTLGFAALTDALLAMAPLEKSARRELLRAERPAWLPVVPGPATRRTNGFWRRVSRWASRLGRISRDEPRFQD